MLEKENSWFELILATKKKLILASKDSLDKISSIKILFGLYHA
jgi:hypothetical protein